MRAEPWVEELNRLVREKPLQHWCADTSCSPRLERREDGDPSSLCNLHGCLC